MPDAVIVDAVRTPVGRGKPGGALSGPHPVDLYAHAFRSLAERTGVDPATERVLRRAGLSLADIDVFEVNEAFASVVLAWQAETGPTWPRSTCTAGPPRSATRWAPAAGG